VIIESRTSLVHTTAFLDDGETLGEGEALKTLSTELFIFKYLTIDRLLQKRKRGGSDASFNIAVEAGRAVEMSDLGSSGHGHSIQTTRSLSQDLFRKQQLAQKL
jgi:hypothetical protein